MADRLLVGFSPLLPDDREYEMRDWKLTANPRTGERTTVVDRHGEEVAEFERERDAEYLMNLLSLVGTAKWTKTRLRRAGLSTNELECMLRRLR